VTNQLPQAALPRDVPQLDDAICTSCRLHDEAVNTEVIICQCRAQTCMHEVQQRSHP
jgi:hypothetical protein